MTNKTILRGRIARMEQKTTANSKPYARLVIAVRRSYKTENGEWREITSFIPTKVIYKNLLQKLNNLNVGDEVIVEGHLEQFWSNSQNPTSIVEVLAERIEVTKRKSQQPAQPEQQAQQVAQPVEQKQEQQPETKQTKKKKRKISEVEGII
jgi:single-stranded DNA-binding protein